MAIFYIDPVNGNDANDGTTFANRWRTWQSGPTAARIGPGDEVRCIASPDPSLVGNATWTDGSRVVTLAAAKTLTIDSGDVAWTGVTNATATANTTAGQRKQGTASANVSVAAAFTTGKLAFKAAALNLSAYQQVSLWLYNSAAVAAGAIELRLCSDTTGDVPVHTIPLAEAALSGGNWSVVVKDFGANLSAAIQSVSIYANTDLGTGTVVLRLDNIIACKAASNADALTHLSLIGKKTTGEPEWYPILSIEGTALELGGANDVTLPTAVARNYVGTTETVATYKLQPLDPNNGFADRALSSARYGFQDSGAEGSPIVISGGWNRTDMSTQTGTTWITGSHWATYGVNLTNRSFLNWSKFGWAHFTSAPADGNTAVVALRWEQDGVVGCGGAGYLLSGKIGAGVYLDLGNVVSCSGYGVSLGGTNNSDITIRARRITGTYGSPGAAVSGAVTPGASITCYIDKADNNQAYGYFITDGALQAFNTAMSNNVTADVAVQSSARVTLRNPTFGSATPISTLGQNDQVRVQKYNGDASDNRVVSTYYRIATDVTTRHTASGLAWKLSPLSSAVFTSVCPARIPLMQRRVAAGVPTTFSCWVRRDNAGLFAGLLIQAGRAGMASDVKTLMTAAADTWEQVGVTFTPAEDGVVELFGIAYGGTTFNAWFDDLTVA